MIGTITGDLIGLVNSCRGRAVRVVRIRLWLWVGIGRVHQGSPPAMMMVMMSVVLWMMRVMFVMDVGVETVVFVGRVRHLSDPAIRLDHAVSAVNHVPMSFLPLAFIVLGVRVLNTVLVSVLGWRLRTEKCHRIRTHRKLDFFFRSFRKC